MKQFLDRISSYHIFNYLLPGVIFAGLGEKLTSYSLIQENILIGLFFYYFVGLIISRIGSLTLEELLKKIEFVHFKPRKDFLKASKLDPKVDILSEQNNMYCTLCSLPIALAAFKFYDQIMKGILPWSADISDYICMLGLFVLFLFSYRKQTGYVVESIETTLEEEQG